MAGHPGQRVHTLRPDSAKCCSPKDTLPSSGLKAQTIAVKVTLTPSPLPLGTFLKVTLVEVPASVPTAQGSHMALQGFLCDPLPVAAPHAELEPMPSLVCQLCHLYPHSTAWLPHQ